jgi:hypothetical protein
MLNFRNAGQDATNLNGHSIQVWSNAAMCREGRTYFNVFNHLF